MKSFELALAEMISPIRGSLETFLDKNPGLPPEARASIARVIGRLYPLCDYKYLEQMRDAYEKRG